MKTELIDSQAELAKACRRWRQSPALGVDTEFVRERTYYPGLGLIQICDGKTAALIDTVALEDLQCLDDVLADSAIVKVFHSCAEDLEALYHRFGKLPDPVFDTQVAAALSGHGYSLGYSRLVADFFDEHLPKGETRTNWLKRPLSEAQIKYAALDVVYLVPAFHRLRDELRQLGREDWLCQELAPLFSVERFLPPIEESHLRIRAWRSLSPRQLATLQRLASWREERARQRNLPRNFVLHEKALVEIARKEPRSKKELATIPSLRPSDARRHGDSLLREVRRAQREARGLSTARKRVADLSPHKRLIKSLRTLVEHTAREKNLPPELLATRKSIERLVRRAIAGKDPIFPEELRGWRQEVLGSRLLETLEVESNLPVTRTRSSA